MAAGASRRMGRPKQLLPLGSGTVLTTVIDTLLAADCNPVVCVLGASSTQVAAALVGWAVETVYNPDWDTGEMLSSVQCGLRHLSQVDTHPGCLIALGDQPGLTAATVRALVGTVAHDPHRMVFCSHGMRRHHPIYLPASLWLRICELPVASTLRAVTGDPQLPVAYVNVDSFDDFRDLDTPEQYDSYRAQAMSDTG
ncbi:MAG: nucleotidyltransferase family protein [Caldilineaceae bacterium]|nr:nucleotidyltransferase family protein [Caldilineaceae bacterium]